MDYITTYGTWRQSWRKKYYKPNLKIIINLLIKIKVPNVFRHNKLYALIYIRRKEEKDFQSSGSFKKEKERQIEIEFSYAAARQTWEKKFIATNNFFQVLITSEIRYKSKKDMTKVLHEVKGG